MVQASFFGVPPAAPGGVPGATVVEPHTTRAGFLFYDVSQLNHPLQGARLHLHALRNADGQELFYFEIPFDTYLKSKSKEMK